MWVFRCRVRGSSGFTVVPFSLLRFRDVVLARFHAMLDDTDESLIVCFSLIRVFEGAQAAFVMFFT